MISTLVANAKGGCGKTTVATNLATAFANAGLKTGLADGDRQQSCLGWIKQRPRSAATIVSLDWHKGPGKVPKDLDRLVIDTGAGLRSKRTLEMLERADMIIMPVLPSFFDERTTRAFLKALEAVKPVRKGRKPIAVVGNRLRSRTRATRELDAFLVALGHEMAAGLRDRSIYPDVARRGLGIFDLSPARRVGAVDEWLPLIRLIEDR
ncbi:MAG: ParA family protein [Hyphomicrobiales bacterium]|nr:ParA family protein [Hyphomicrobiales bacterium]